MMKRVNFNSFIAKSLLKTMLLILVDFRALTEKGLSEALSEAPSEALSEALALADTSEPWPRGLEV